MTGPSPSANSRSKPIGSRIGNKSEKIIAASTPKPLDGRQHHLGAQLRVLAEFQKSRLRADRRDTRACSGRLAASARSAFARPARDGRPAGTGCRTRSGRRRRSAAGGTIAALGAAALGRGGHRASLPASTVARLLGGQRPRVGPSCYARARYRRQLELAQRFAGGRSDRGHGHPLQRCARRWASPRSFGHAQQVDHLVSST